MKSSDLLISNRDGIYTIKVSGRANFEYAVPMRDIAKNSVAIRGVKIDLGDCVAMDSTFMGVLTMLALAARRSNAAVELLNASDVLQKLLQGLGVKRLFVFKNGSVASGGSGTGMSSMLKTAETVAEAHKTLVQADQLNADRFADVIRFADEDVKKLREKDAE